MDKAGLRIQPVQPIYGCQRDSNRERTPSLSRKDSIKDGDFSSDLECKDTSHVQEYSNKQTKKVSFSIFEEYMLTRDYKKIR